MSKQQEALHIALEALKQIDEAMPFPVAKLAQAAIKEALAQPEFIKHEVENADDWSEWVCPDPKNYLMKCCDCGLVHEAEFGVVRYKSETERDDCDMVDDPNLQAVFRMRRSEEWTPEDTAHRAGGLPMAQPEQAPMNYYRADAEGNLERTDIHFAQTESVACDCDSPSWCKQYKKCNRKMLGFMPYVAQPQRTWIGLTLDERIELAQDVDWAAGAYCEYAEKIESKLKEKNVVC